MNYIEKPLLESYYNLCNKFIDSIILNIYSPDYDKIKTLIDTVMDKYKKQSTYYKYLVDSINSKNDVHKIIELINKKNINHVDQFIDIACVLIELNRIMINDDEIIMMIEQYLKSETLAHKLIKNKKFIDLVPELSTIGYTYGEYTHDIFKDDILKIYNDIGENEIKDRTIKQNIIDIEPPKIRSIQSIAPNVSNTLNETDKIYENKEIDDTFINKIPPYVIGTSLFVAASSIAFYLSKK